MRGFSLAETIIVVTVGVIVATLLLSILVNNTGVFYTEQTRVQQGVDINGALSPFRSNVKTASSVVTSFTDGQTTYTSSPTVLILSVPSIDSSSNIINNTFDNFVYIVDSSILYQKVFPSAVSYRKKTGKLLTGNVIKIFFEYFDAAGLPVVPSSAVKVRLTLTLQQKLGNNVETNIATSEAYLRND